MLKVAIIGCGKIADSHAAQIRRISGCEIVAAYDREPLMARQFCDRFSVKGCYTDIEVLLATKPDVVHVTTPPQSHFQLAKQCLMAGCHVYLEKPFTVYWREAEELIDLAEQRGLKITAGHDDQFSHVSRRMRSEIAEGYLGGGPLHMESYYCYELGTNLYGSALLNDQNHWVRKLPGKLLQNIISHGIARIAEYLTCDSPEIIVHGATSSTLRAFGETEIIDELRVIISEPSGTTAYFTFSSQMRPALHVFRIYGSRNGLELDQDQETLIYLPGMRYKSYAQKFIPPLLMVRLYLVNLYKNLMLFLRSDFHMKSGMKCLIESFYSCITQGTQVPIPYREILLVSRIMDGIFAQLQARSSAEELHAGIGPIHD